MRRIERYLRASVEIPDGSVEIGLEITDGKTTRESLRHVVHMAYLQARSIVEWTNAEEFADSLAPVLEVSMRSVWPDRAWFVEIWDEKQALTQVYSPYGMPITAP
jgi:hypothetical protein